jgi:hypothetical protein
MFAYKLPGGWVDNPKPERQRIFEFHAGEALVTLTILGGEAGGVAANVNRWRQQAGLEALDDDQAVDSTTPARFLGGEGRKVSIEGPSQSILGVFLLSADFSIFLKMDGPTAAVTSQKKAFDELWQSFKMTGAGHD